MPERTFEWFFEALSDFRSRHPVVRGQRVDEMSLHLEMEQLGSGWFTACLCPEFDTNDLAQVEKALLRQIDSTNNCSCCFDSQEELCDLLDGSRMPDWRFADE